MVAATQQSMLNDNNLESLKAFHRKAQELREHEDFFKKISINLKFGDGKGEIDRNFPDPKTIKALLVDFRPFTLEKEGVNFLRICKTICDKRNNVDTLLVDKTNEAKIIWVRLLDTGKTNPLVGGIGFNAFGKNFKQGEILDLWLNGKYFHPSDQKKQKYKELERVSMHPFSDLLEIDFIDTVQRMSGLIFWLDFNVVERILNDK